MLSSRGNQYSIDVDISGKALSQHEVEQTQKRLHTFYKSNLSFLFAIVVLGLAVTYRAITLEYDKEYELLKISLYIGLWFGLFTGFMINGSIKYKIQLVLVGIIISSSASLFASMLVMLMIGKATVWISSVNILASSLSSIWVLTRYDDVLKGIESTKEVDQEQFAYIRKASTQFEELYNYSLKIISEDRMPLTAEYWAFRDWVKDRASSRKS